MGKDQATTATKTTKATQTTDAKDAAGAAKDYVLETAAAVKDYVAQSAEAAKDFVAEKAIHGKDLAIEKALVMKDAVVENAIASKDFIAEKAVMGKDFVVEKAGAAKEIVKERTLGSNNILANTADKSRSQTGVDANRAKTGVGPTAYETMVENAEKAKAQEAKDLHLPQIDQKQPQRDFMVREVSITNAPQMGGVASERPSDISKEQKVPQMSAPPPSEGGIAPNILAGATAQQVAKESEQCGTKSPTPVTEHLRKQDQERPATN